MKGAYTLHLKSSLVEEAANELINTLLDVTDDKLLSESRTEEMNEGKN